MVEIMEPLGLSVAAHISGVGVAGILRLDGGFTYVIIDLQSVKTAGSGKEHGFDGEKTKGRKRHIVMDMMGNIVCLLEKIIRR